MATDAEGPRRQKAALVEMPIHRLLVGDRKARDLRLEGVDDQGARRRNRTVAVLLAPILAPQMRLRGLTPSR